MYTSDIGHQQHQQPLRKLLNLHLTSADSNSKIITAGIVLWHTGMTATRSSAVAQRPCYTSCLSVVSFNSTIGQVQSY